MWTWKDRTHHNVFVLSEFHKFMGDINRSSILLSPNFPGAKGLWTDLCGPAKLGLSRMFLCSELNKFVWDVCGQNILLSPNFPGAKRLRAICSEFHKIILCLCFGWRVGNVTSLSFQNYEFSLGVVPPISIYPSLLSAICPHSYQLR